MNALRYVKFVIQLLRTCSLIDWLFFFPWDLSSNFPSILSSNYCSNIYIYIKVKYSIKMKVFVFPICQNRFIGFESDKKQVAFFYK